jgi:hypothetical protein
MRKTRTVCSNFFEPKKFKLSVCNPLIEFQWNTIFIFCWKWQNVNKKIYEIFSILFSLVQQNNKNCSPLNVSELIAHGKIKIFWFEKIWVIVRVFLIWCNMLHLLPTTDATYCINNFAFFFCGWTKQEEFFHL